GRSVVNTAVLTAAFGARTLTLAVTVVGSGFAISTLSAFMIDGSGLTVGFAGLAATDLSGPAGWAAGGAVATVFSTATHAPLPSLNTGLSDGQRQDCAVSASGAAQASFGACSSQLPALLFQ